MTGEEVDEHNKAAERRKEDNAITVHLIPMFMTFIICGVVCSTGYTFFLAQANTLNSEKLVSFLVFFYNVGKLIGGLFSKITNWLLKSDTHNRRRFAPSFGIGLAMLLTVLTTITAALVETKRRKDKSMTIWWLLPQSVLVGGLDGIYEDSIHNLFVDGLSTSREKKIPIFANAVFGAGIMGNALLVFIVSKASKDLIPEDLNSGYLTKYYWLLTVLSALNLLAYLFIAIWFAHEFLSVKQVPGESTQPVGEPSNNNEDDGGLSNDGGEEANKHGEPAERHKEDNAITVHLIPMFMTFIICGVICSTSYTFFLIQLDLVGGLDVIYEDSIQNLFVNRLSDTKKIPIFANAVFDAGIAGNALLVFIVSKANKNWIPKDLNSGYLNDYYWLLMVMSALNLVAYIFIAIWFAHLYLSAESTPSVEQGPGELTQPEGEPDDNNDDNGEISEKEVKNCMCC
ncbi:hypothetical protein Nepgr_032792 [Nepenthes gracilis]|uniref:Uncharacterized protein n=1 Tax=Nepenthes gracilis TaxID=150966 RepID=A0AAD3TKR9_NEPGR|nr:hypothetical protein Nepgr_032792 [Nepenthes gracilis]